MPPHLYLDVVEAWYWERFSKQEQVDDWLSTLNAPASMDWAAQVDGILDGGLQDAARDFLLKLGADTADVLGWDREAPEHAGVAIGVMVIDQ